MQTVTYRGRVNGVLVEFEYVYDDGNAEWRVRPIGRPESPQEVLYLLADGNYSLERFDENKTEP